MRSSSARLAAWLAMGMIGSAAADSPSRPPYDHAVCSDSARYCAFVSATDGAKIFEVSGGNNIVVPLYAITGWFSQSYLSDDGQKFVEVASIIVPGHLQDQAVARVWIGGQLTRSVFLQDLIGKKKPTKSSSGFVWGNAVGFRGNDKFILRLENGREFEIKF